MPYRNVVLVELAAGKAELAEQLMARLSQARVRLARAIASSDGTLPDVLGALAVEPVAFPPLAEHPGARPSALLAGTCTG